MQVNLDGLAKAAEALSAPLTKLIEVAASGLGTLGGPPLLILRAHCEGKAALIRSGYDQQLRRLEARHAEELRALPAATTRELPAGELSADEIEVVFEEDDRAEVKRAADTFAVQTLRRRANAMAVLGEAADNIGGEVSCEAVDVDWVARFFDGAQDVSAADLQKLWGRLLAREVEQPGTIPLRTLELLRTMSRGDAELVRRLKMHMAQRPLVYFYEFEANLTLDELQQLQDIGVLSEILSTPQWDIKEDPASVNACKIAISFFGGALLRIESYDEVALTCFRARPAAIPLLLALPETTSSEYVRRIHRELDSQQNVWVELTGLQLP